MAIRDGITDGKSKGRSTIATSGVPARARHCADNVVFGDDNCPKAIYGDRVGHAVCRAADLAKQAIAYDAAGRVRGKINAILPAVRDPHVIDQLVDITGPPGKLNANLAESDCAIFNSNIPKSIGAYSDNSVGFVVRSYNKECVEIDRHIMLLDRDNVASHRAGNDILG